MFVLSSPTPCERLHSATLMAVTPRRHTRLRIGTDEVTLGRKAFDLCRTAAEIADAKVRADPEYPRSEHVVFLGAAWGLSAPNSELVYADREAFIPASAVNLAPGIVVQPQFRKLTDPGMGGHGSLVATGGNAFRKTVTADAYDWSTAVLGPDAAAYSGPTLSTRQSYPLDRVLSGKVTYPGNAGFALFFRPPCTFAGTEAFLRFYFGGSTEVYPETASGGAWALTFFQDGHALLEERLETDGSWQARSELPWAEAGRAADDWHSIQVRPYGRNRLCLYSRGATGGVVRTPLGFSGAFLSPTAGHLRPLYLERASDTGHVHRKRFSGDGPIRADLLRNYRYPWGVARLRYPEEGVLVDNPFVIRHGTPADTPITLHTNAFLLPNTGCTGAIFDADTHVALATDSEGRFLTNAGQTVYYVKYVLGSDPDGYASPHLFDYRLAMDGAFNVYSRTPVELPPSRVSITGPDTSPDHDTAGVDLHDLLGEGAVLRQRDDIACDLIVRDDDGEVVTRLFEGVTAQQPATKAGVGASVFTAHYDYDLQLLGKWTRLSRAVPHEMLKFARDLDAPPDDEGNPVDVAPLVLTIMRKLFNDGGVPDEELDLREDIYGDAQLQASSFTTSDDWTIQPGGTATYTRSLQRLAKDFLGAVLCRDTNAGPLDGDGIPRGMFRLLANPTDYSGDPLAEFVTERPISAAGKWGTAPEAYGTGAAGWPIEFIEQEHFRPQIIGPECNYVKVVGAAEYTADGDVEAICSNELYNFVSNQFFEDQPIDADPDHPDFLGYEAPVFVFDPELVGQEAVDFATRRIFDFSAHAQPWVHFYGPLVLVTDASDAQQVLPRPLRVNDLVKVAGLKALVRSCNPDIPEHDKIQMAHYSVLWVE